MLFTIFRHIFWAWLSRKSLSFDQIKWILDVLQKSVWTALTASSYPGFWILAFGKRDFTSVYGRLSFFIYSPRWSGFFGYNIIHYNIIHKVFPWPSVFPLETENYSTKVFKSVMVWFYSLNIIISDQVIDRIFILIRDWESFDSF